MLTTNGDCDVCGAANGSCGDFLSGLPVGFAGEPKENGMPKSGRFYRTTERVFRNGRLVLGAGLDIPWEQAVEFGLVEAPPSTTLAHFTPPEEPAEPSVEVVDVKPELVSNEDVTAAIKRRPKRTPGARLGSVS